MRLLPAAFAIAASIAVTACFADWSKQANAEFCAEKIEAAKAPITGPLGIASNAQIIYQLSKQLPHCDGSLKGDQALNVVLGGILTGFIVYFFCLLFGKFSRWAER
jgi:hypothetical protein